MTAQPDKLVVKEDRLAADALFTAAADFPLTVKLHALVSEHFAVHRQRAMLQAAADEREACATGPWLAVGTFTPDPDAHYLVRGTMFLRVKLGREIDPDNVEAAFIRERMT